MTCLFGHRWLIVLFWTACLPTRQLVGALLELGIIKSTHSFDDIGGLISYSRSAFNGTGIELRVHCEGADQPEYTLQLVIRSSACDKEFSEVLSLDDRQAATGALGKAGNRVNSTYQWHSFYFDYKESIPPGFTYHYSWNYRSQEWRHKCGEDVLIQNNPDLTKKQPKFERVPVTPMVQAGTTNAKKRSTRAVNNVATVTLSGGSSENPAKGTFHPLVNVPEDGIYLLLLKVTPLSEKPFRMNMTFQVTLKSPSGYLSAIDFPLFPFYAVMCALYGMLALAWLVMSALHWRDLLRVQFWIGAVIFLGMLEMAVFCAEYQNMNLRGTSVTYAIEMAEIISCLKKTLSRMLVIIVSVGFGVVKPRLGSTLHKVVGVGFLYFILCSIESVSRVAKVQQEGAKQKQLVALPLILLEVGICWWIFSALLTTTRALRARRNEVKLWLYRHFTNTLIFAVLASVAFMLWSLSMHTFTQCLTDWKEIWVDTAFWHLLFFVILVVILILWRPTNNNTRYAFSPLLDAVSDEDDDEEETVFSEAFTDNDAMKIKNLKKHNEVNHGKEEPSLEEDLKWVEEHMTNTLADRALPAMVDSDEEKETMQYELSKMQ